jgi:hypothetical protein
MALMDWLRRRLAGDEKAELTLSPEEKSLSGLDLQQVLGAHMAWKEKLQTTLDGKSTEKLDPRVVAQDNLCVLGKWLYGPGKPLYSHLPAYETLRRTHADFHLCAGEVLTKYQSNNPNAAAVLLRGKFRSTSNKIQLDLVQLFASAQSKKK